jgi:hypothetical protein
MSHPPRPDHPLEVLYASAYDVPEPTRRAFRNRPPRSMVALAPKQAMTIAELAEHAAYVEVEDRGAGYRAITSFDTDGDEIDRRQVFPDGSYGAADSAQADARRPARRG